MTELSLIFGVAIASLLFAAALGQWTLAQRSGNHDVGRLLNAVQRASDAFLWRENKLIAAGILFLVPGCAVLNTLTSEGSPPPHGVVEAALWGGAGLLAGAGLGSLVAHLSTQLTLRAAARTADAARVDINHTVTVALRGSCVAILISETLALLSVGLMFALLWSTTPGFEIQNFSALLRRITLLPGFALGAVWAALVIQLGGTTFQAAGDVGSVTRGGAPKSDSERNPALVANLMGDQIGLGASLAVDAFVVTTLASITGLTVATAVVTGNENGFASGFAVVSLPLVLRTLSLFASACGVMATRADETSDASGVPTAALWRGHLTATTISLGGMAGACLWLIGGTTWAAFYLAGALGLFAASGAAHITRFRLTRRSSSLSGKSDPPPVVSDETLIAHGLGVGLGVFVLPVILVGLSLIAAWTLGSRTGLNGAGFLAMVVALAGMLSTQSYVYTIGAFHPIADSARAVARLKLSRLPEEAQRRATRVDAAGFAGASVAQTYAICVGSVAALLTSLTLPLLSQRQTAALNLTEPTVLWSGVLGGALVFAYAGKALRYSSRAAQAVREEVERQLLDQASAGVAPSYRSSVQIATNSALHRLMLRVLTPLFVTSLLGISLRVLYRSDPAIALQSMMAFAAVAAVTGFGAALSADGARTALGTLRRQHLAGEAVPKDTAISGHAFATFVGYSVGPSAQVVTKAVAIVCLTLMPLFQLPL